MKKYIFFCWGLLLASPIIVHSQHRTSSYIDKDPIEVLQKYDRRFTRDYLQAMLQKMVDRTYLSGFRYLGDPHDFNHGHILFVKTTHGKIEPIAILYHTQEDASDYHRKSPGSKYDYLDPRTRNWIQWLDQDGLVENANRYERIHYPSGKLWENYVKYDLPWYRKHFTIEEVMLDPQVLGGEIIYALGWFFIKSNISVSPFITKPDEGRMIKIFLPRSNEEVDLSFERIFCSPTTVISKNYCKK